MRWGRSATIRAMRYLNAAALILPATVALLLAGALVGAQENLYLVAIGIGIIEVSVVGYREVRRRSWSLDYIALLAMVVAAFSYE